MGKGHKVFFLKNVILLYGGTFSKIRQADQDLSQNEIFDLQYWPLSIGVKVMGNNVFIVFDITYLVQLWTKSD